MKSLIIGAGEIGKSLHEVLQTAHESHIRDKEDLKLDKVDVLNICYPYFKDFTAQTKKYIAQYKPKVTIIHSTVKPGTTKACGDFVVHSPCHGRHPRLAQGIMTFTKYVGGENIYATYMADKFLQEAGIKTEVVTNSATSELSKIMCTSYYGWNLLFMKEMVSICKKAGVPFSEVYTRWNSHYNEGYAQMGYPQFIRPVLDPMPGEIGGHCIVPNCELAENYITTTIKERNKLYKEDKNGTKNLA